MGTGHPALGVEWPGGLGRLGVTAAPNTPLLAQHSVLKAEWWLVPQQRLGTGRLVVLMVAGVG